MRAEFVGSLSGLYPDELEGSLCLAYAPRDPLAEFYLGIITPRKLRVMVSTLPLDSAFVRAMNGTSWRDTDAIMHDVSWQLRQLVALTYNVNSEKGKSAPEPKPLPTPWDETELTAAEAADLEQQHAEVDLISARMFALNP